MNPNKKRESIKRVKAAYRQYTLDLLEYNKQIMDVGSNNISSNVNPDEYYQSQEVKPMPIKPDIRYYMPKEDVKTLKNILLKKRGYEDVKLM